MPTMPFKWTNFYYIEINSFLIDDTLNYRVRKFVAVGFFFAHFHSISSHSNTFYVDLVHVLQTNSVSFIWRLLFFSFICTLQGLEWRLKYVRIKTEICVYYCNHFSHILSACQVRFAYIPGS